MDFFDRVKDLTKKNTTLTLRAFIESQGLNYETYYSGKRRDNLPRADEALQIAQALNTTVEYLVSGNEPENSKQTVLDDLQVFIDTHRWTLLSVNTPPLHADTEIGGYLWQNLKALAQNAGEAPLLTL